jgi:hypothetical protein
MFDNPAIVVEFRNDLFGEPNHDPGGGEQYLLAGEGVVGPNSDDWTESLHGTLYTLCMTWSISS